MKKILLSLSLLAFSAGLLFADGSEFTVTNNSDSKIVKLLAKEAGKSQWGSFNIGGGIAPGKSIKIEWSESTDGTDCEWSLIAHFADGSKSDAASFDFCENPEIEFD
ncbi:MAG: hypothetical protein KDK38_14405 [Leptospiraceae bacterium]|nr:hypothetical protein [Leptospiraceae bacterium]